VLNKKCGFIKK